MARKEEGMLACMVEDMDCTFALEDMDRMAAGIPALERMEEGIQAEQPQSRLVVVEMARSIRCLNNQLYPHSGWSLSNLSK